MSKLSPKDAFLGELAAYTTRTPWLREKLHGEPHRRMTLLDFRCAHTPVDDLGLTEIERSPKFEVAHGAPQSEWPVHILALSSTALRGALAQEEGTRLGYAFNAPQIGRAVLVGLVPRGHLSAPARSFAAGISVGEEPMLGGLVTVYPDLTLGDIPGLQTPVAAGLPGLDPQYPLPESVPTGIPMY